MFGYDYDFIQPYMDEHDLIVAVKQLSLELGVTPTRGQFEKHVKGSHYGLARVGGYNKLLNLAGLVPYNERRITNQIFEKNIESHLQEYIPKDRAKEPRIPYASIAVISDIHWPFCNQKVIDAFFEYAGDIKPEYVIINGDAFDMFSHSRFPKSPNIFTPAEEEKLAKSQNTKFWEEIKKRSPKSKCIQMLGNHDIRPLKQVLSSYPAVSDWVEKYLHELLTFDGVKTIYDYREEFLIGDIAVFHGYRSKLGDHRDNILMNCINGHTHLGGAVFRRLGNGQIIWELNSGLAGDPESKGLTYTPQKIINWTPGFGAVDKNGPRFIWV